MSDAKFHLNLGTEFPYDEGRHEKDWAHKAARGVLSDLCDRRGVKGQLEDCDEDIRIEIVDAMSDIIRLSASEIIAQRNELIKNAKVVLQISDREHEAWTALKATISKIEETK